MADWKQITARIRRARTSKDPVGQLSNLYEKTNDAMVAYELAKYFETAGQNADAAKWYVTAGERFRRADWKTKAKEAAVRLGAEIPLESPVQRADDFILTPPPELPSEQAIPFAEEIPAPELAEASAEEAPAAAVAESAEKKRRRRGRRGGRHRRKTGVGPEAAVAAPAERAARPAPQRRAAPPVAPEELAEPIPPRVPHTRAIPQLPVEPLGEMGGAGLKGRYGDPGLSSRISLLEMQFRRLLTCPPAKLDEADRAPVGPGVFVLTDSDLTTYYYVESCQTLRIAIGNLLRGGANRRGGESIKPQLAEHLGIPETRVAKYLADHCVVRWLQLDEGASHFAHFVIAVLRPILNE